MQAGVLRLSRIDDGETIAFIHYLLVDPEYQGQHIGDWSLIAL
ncbi:GNAT family N-acetyltransferase [Butyrivibrio sp. ob235]